MPFVCGCRNLGEALRRIGEGAAMIRTKGEAGTGNVVEAVRHMRAVTAGLQRLTILGDEELMTEAKKLGAPYELVRKVAQDGGRLPVPNFAAGGIATPADAALMMALGAEAVFVGSGIFKSADPAARAKAIVRATTHYRDAAIVAEASRGLGERDEGARRRVDPGRREAAGPRLVTATAMAAQPLAAVRRRQVGVLALQGDFAAHAAMLKALGAEVREVRRVSHLDGLDALVLPGGESTALLKLMADEPWFEALGGFARARRRAPRHLRRRHPAGARGARPAPALLSACSTPWSSATPTAASANRSRARSRHPPWAAPSAASSSALPASSRPARASRCSPPATANRCSSAKAASSPAPSTPNWPAKKACTANCCVLATQV